MSTAEQLVAWSRAHRPVDAIGAGDIRDPALIVECLTAVLQQHLEHIAPAGEPERMLIGPQGYFREPAKAAPPFDIARASTDETAFALALLIGHLREAQPESDPRRTPSSVEGGPKPEVSRTRRR